MTPLTVLGVALAAYLTFDFVRYLRSGKLRRHLTVFVARSTANWAGVSAGVALNLAVVFAIIVVLLSLRSPILEWSWLRLLATPADGPQAGTNLVARPAEYPVFGGMFLLLLLLNVPRLARREEEIFRRGTRDWKGALPRSLKFGFIHMLVGVPVAAALALSVAGLFFTWHYFRGGIRSASFAHTLHNFAIVALLAYVIFSGPNRP